MLRNYTMLQRWQTKYRMCFMMILLYDSHESPGQFRIHIRVCVCQWCVTDRICSRVLCYGQWKTLSPVHMLFWASMYLYSTACTLCCMFYFIYFQTITRKDQIWSEKLNFCLFLIWWKKGQGSKSVLEIQKKGFFFRLNCTRFCAK